MTGVQKEIRRLDNVDLKWYKARKRGTFLVLVQPPPDCTYGPGFAALRITGAVTLQEAKATVEELLELGGATGEAHGRSSTPAYHFGLWSKYRLVPIVSGDTKKLLKRQQEVLHKVFRRVRSICKRLETILQVHDPEYVETLRRYVCIVTSADYISDMFIKDHILRRDVLSQRPQASRLRFRPGRPLFRHGLQTGWF